VKGLRLYVRPIEAADHDALRTFLGTDTPPACGLLGKLLGDLVAVVTLEITADALRVRDIFVAESLRKKRIGRVMMREVEQLAAKLEQRRIIVEDARDAQEFFRRVGFESEGDRWVRVVA
jgi:GNAT superfamily N-acetyltransferase